MIVFNFSNAKSMVIGLFVRYVDIILLAIFAC